MTLAFLFILSISIFGFGGPFGVLWEVLGDVRSAGSTFSLSPASCQARIMDFFPETISSGSLTSEIVHEYSSGPFGVRFPRYLFSDVHSVVVIINLRRPVEHVQRIRRLYRHGSRKLGVGGNAR